MRRTMPTRAPRRSRRGVRMALPRCRRSAAARAAWRGGGATARGAVAVARLSAGARQARRSAPRIRRARGEQERSFTVLVSEPAATPAAEVGLGRIAAAQRQHTRGHRSLRARRDALPRARRRALRDGALAIERSGDRDEAQKALEQHDRYGARWPALRRSGAGHGHRPARGRRRDSAARRQARRCGRYRRGDRRARGRARSRLRADAGARQPDFSLRAHAQLVQSRGALSRRSSAPASASPTCTTTTPCCWACRRSGISRRTPTVRRWRSIPMHPQAQNNLGQTLERQRKFAEAADSLSPRGGESARLQAGAIQPRAHAHRVGEARRSHRRAREDRRASRCGRAALPVRLGRRARARGPQSRRHQVVDASEGSRAAVRTDTISPQRSIANSRR